MPSTTVRAEDGAAGNGGAGGRDTDAEGTEPGAADTGNGAGRAPAVGPERTARRLAASALAAEGRVPGPSPDAWLAERGLAGALRVDRVPLSELTGWSFAPGTGDLRHDSGRFFSVEGLSVRRETGPVDSWSQPVLVQSDIGVLGLLAKEFDGVLHFLMQAKMEPGNATRTQLCPTVQATRSNYTGVHGGAPVPYLDHFLRPGRGRVLVDVLQSEMGSWFHRKRNRNMVVEVLDDVPVGDDFRWMTMGEVLDRLRQDDVVNMDVRTILACLPLAARGTGAPRRGPARHEDAELAHWFTDMKARHPMVTRRVPLAAVDGWTRGPDEIAHEDGRYFRVIGVRVEATQREVRSWSQPLLAPVAEGVVAFLLRRFDGVPHVLVQARVEAGLLDGVEWAPTVQCTPANLAGTGLPRPRYLDAVLGAPADAVRYDTLLSDEGGRSYHSLARHLVVEAGPDVPDEEPDGFRWVSLGQLAAFARHGYQVNVQARSLLSVLYGLWAEGARVGAEESS
ncbi:NDP-hexose 2,3-dehydratase family protein [Streptomyces hydrogenans]|uniref:NDP-hexose 2,3-dehydratase family protein n=1 Tax=Streptomyces hydrogenans TaxID=1873719 RepID=UPI0035DD815D